MHDMVDRKDVSRRDFFRGKLLKPIRDAARRSAGADASRSKIDYSLTLLQRPPGAVAEGQFLSSCTRCGDCITACPPKAIRIAPPEAGERRAGTPYIDAIHQACVMCTDTPCITACEPGVLRMDLPLKMATVRIDPVACLPYQGQPCSMCIDHCPVEGALSTDDMKRPVIDSTVCTGCGVCMQVCPAPRNAVELRPLDSRPFAHD